MLWCNILTVDKKCYPAQGITVTVSVFILSVCTFVLRYLERNYATPGLSVLKLWCLQIQFSQCKSNFISLLSCRAQSHHCGLGQCWKDNHTVSVVSSFLELHESVIQTLHDFFLCVFLNACFLPTPPVWRRRPSTRRPPLAATLSRSPCVTHTSWSGISEDRRAFEPAGTPTTAAQRYGSLTVFNTWQINMAFCWFSCAPAAAHWSPWFSWLSALVVLCSNVKTRYRKDSKSL